MYTNPSNIIKTIIKLLNRNADIINRVIQEYEDGSVLNVFEGMRKSLPTSAFPSLEIEPTSNSTEWYSVRTQKARYGFQFTLTVSNDNEDYGVEYPASIATILTEILNNPGNLQLQIENEKKWDVNDGLVDSYIMNSMCENVTMNASKDGSIRIVQFDWFAEVMEPFADSAWKYGNYAQPTPVRQNIQVP